MASNFDKSSLLYGIIGYRLGYVCPESEDNYHHAQKCDRSRYDKATSQEIYLCTCEYCGKSFEAYETDLKQSYETQVSEMEDKYHTTTIDANGFSNVKLTGWTRKDSPSGVTVVNFNPDIIDLYWTVTSNKNNTYFSLLTSRDFSFPVDGTYTVLFPSFNKYPSDIGFLLYSFTLQYSSDNGQTWSDVDYRQVGINILGSESIQVDGKLIIGGPYSFSFTVTHLFKYRFLFNPNVAPDSSLGSSAYFRFSDYVYIKGVQAVPSGDIVYSPATRPTSITGNYGIIGDDGKLIQVTGNTIINETNNTYYNPATGETVPITNWSYDYSDRSYTVTTEEGDSYTITYGDENVTINEGDTVYNIYYIVNGSGSGGGEDPPSSCAHDWAETARTAPTCTAPGEITYTCGLCGETKTEPIAATGHAWEEASRADPACTVPGWVKSICSKCGETKTDPLKATGHTWEVERTVQTAYDDEGNLTQQGYTLYKCSVCGEQYKDTDSTGPPGNPGDSGGEDSGDDKESIWDKLGKFLGSLLGGIGDLLNAVLSKLLDALASLAGTLLEKLTGVVETVLNVFDELPKLFGGFLDLLGILFPFLPPEITLLLTFGVIAVVFAAIIKAIRS